MCIRDRINVVSAAPEGESVITVGVKPETGKSYTVNVLKGTLRRLVIPPGQTVVLDLDPKPKTDVGFGGKGQGGRIRVVSGVLGVVDVYKRQEVEGMVVDDLGYVPFGMLMAYGIASPANEARSLLGLERDDFDGVLILSDNFEGAAAWIEPVSYTHLDVYKRQGPESGFPAMALLPGCRPNRSE